MRHQNKHIREAIKYALRRGWRLEKAAGGSAHVWRILLCPHAARDGHRFRVTGTPRNPENHAKRFRAAVDARPHSIAPD